jgi:hypothetical protein
MNREAAKGPTIPLILGKWEKCWVRREVPNPREVVENAKAISMVTTYTVSTMSEDEGEQRAALKQWLQDRLAEVERERERLTALLEVIDMAAADQPSVEVEPSTGLTLSDVRDALGRDFTDLLDIQVEGTVVVIRRRQFLERAVWDAITEKVRRLNGNWISAGEDSRWEIGRT